VSNEAILVPAPMRGAKKFLVICAFVLGVLVLLGFLGFGLITLGMLPGLLVFLVIVLFYGWMLFAYLHYRQGRQEEVLHLLTTAVEAEVPLGPALWAYLEDRPQGVEREAWLAILLFFVFPGYYWIWHRRHSFDTKVAALAHLLELGVPLPQALRAVPGVASREVLLAAAVGQTTGRLALCLRNAARSQLGTLWLQLVARLVYPLLLVGFMLGITGFWMNYIHPRMVRIFAEFGEPLPESTLRLIDAWYLVEDYGWIAGLVFQGLLGLVGLLLLSSTLRWYLPGVARLYRMHVQGRVLRMLALLLEAGKPVPEALGTLADSGYFARVARRKLRGTRRLVEQGESLASSLQRRRLLPAAMVPLVHAAERVRNLPWALTELGENRSSLSRRLLQRLSMGVFPVLVLVVGLMVGFIILGMFTPMIELVSRVGE
jgi:type IV pilus assembly protein PilC